MNTTAPATMSPVLALVSIEGLGNVWAVCFYSDGWYWDHDGTPVVSALCEVAGPQQCSQPATVIGWVALPEIPNA